MKRVFFIDFDGTITKKDVCVTMVDTFCRQGWKEINARWERKEISTEECARLTFELLEATEDDLYRMLDGIEIDDYFFEFVERCRESGEKIFILSDGYDVMIRYVLTKNNLAELPFYANQLVNEGGRYSIKCPYHNVSCGQCGTCKKKLLQEIKSEGCIAVYIGDGYSDICASRAADFVYAKGALLEYCQNNNIPAVSFTDFHDIIRSAFSDDVNVAQNYRVWSTKI